MYHGWEGKFSEILATPIYSKNPRVNKDIWYDDDMIIVEWKGLLQLVFSEQFTQGCYLG